LRRLSIALRDLERSVLQRLAPLGLNHFSEPALAYDLCPNATAQPPQPLSQGPSQSALAGLFDGFLWGAVPKSRRSRERRATRQHGLHKVRDYMTPKRNLIECLDCGVYHEAHSICGACYQKVREETEAMKASMDPEARLFNVPHTEVVYVYKGEESERKMFNGKYVVEVDRPRPEWFPKNLLTKGHGRY